MIKCGEKWIGLQFNFPLIWCPTPIYQCIYKWDLYVENMFWPPIEKTIGYYTIGEFRDSPYNLTNLHQSSTNFNLD